MQIGCLAIWALWLVLKFTMLVAQRPEGDFRRLRRAFKAEWPKTQNRLQ